MAVRVLFLFAALSIAPVTAQAAPKGDGGYRIVHPHAPLQSVPYFRDTGKASDDQIFVRDKLFQREYREAHARLGDMARGGDVWAMRTLAGLYANGLGVARDDQAALRWYLSAAERGDASSALALGIAFDRGLFVGRDAELAVYWYAAAERHGDAKVKSAIRRARAGAIS